MTDTQHAAFEEALRTVPIRDNGDKIQKFYHLLKIQARKKAPHLARWTRRLYDVISA